MKSYDVECFFGIENVERDVQPGLRMVAEVEGWESIAILVAYGELRRTAHHLMDEVRRYSWAKQAQESSGESVPILFSLLRKIEKPHLKFCQKFAIFFAGEWSHDVRPRYYFSSINALIERLTQESFWGGVYLVPETGILQENDDSPCIFNIGSYARPTAQKRLDRAKRR